MTNFYELADHTRADLIFEKHQLLAPLGEGMVQPPHPMVDGMEERDYYQGKVAKGTLEQRKYVEHLASRADAAGDHADDQATPRAGGPTVEGGDAK